jgi:hypothetical protein
MTETVQRNVMRHIWEDLHTLGKQTRLFAMVHEF